MTAQVCSPQALFEQLFEEFLVTSILVRTTAAAKEKINAAGFQSSSKLIKRVLRNNPNGTAAAVSRFEEEEDLSHFDEGDFEGHLLDAIERNISNVDEYGLDIAGYPPWFTEWAVTLAKLLRISRRKRLSIPLESRGILLFCSHDDSEEKVIAMLGEATSDMPRSVCVLGTDDRMVFHEKLKETYTNEPMQFVLKPDSESLSSSINDGDLLDFLLKVSESHAAVRKPDESNQKKKKAIPHISSNAARSKPTDEDLIAMRSIILCMEEELQGTTPRGYTDIVCSGSDYEIQGLAYIYSALSHVKALAKAQGSSKTPSEGKPDDSVNIGKAISDLDKAITVLLKYDCKWDAMLAAVFMATIGKDVEARKLGTISATMELQSRSDFARAALSLELCTFNSEKQRKRMFYLVMAGQLYVQAGLQKLTKRCFLLALPLYKEKGWNLASDFLHGALSRFEPLFCIDALNGISDNCDLINCHTRLSYDDIFFRPSWCNPDREMTHLRKLMKLTNSPCSNDLIAEKNASTVVSCAYTIYPALLYGKHEIPLVNDVMPFLVRIPFVLLRSVEGIPGKNCELVLIDSTSVSRETPTDHPYNTADDFELQEVAITNIVKAKAERDPTWKVFHDFITDYGNISYRLDTDPSGYSIPKQKTNPKSNYLLGTYSVVKMEFINPLHINMHCDEFHLLVEDDKEKWWESATVIKMETTEAGKDQEKFVYLIEGERRLVHLMFKVTKPGTFRITGFAWKLFGRVQCWVPLYLSGQRKTKGDPLKNERTESLRSYVDARQNNAGLSFSIVEAYPQVNISLSKVKRLPANMKPLNKDDENLITLKHYFEAVNVDEPDEFKNNGYLSMGDALSGEFVITRIAIKNIGDKPIHSVTLHLKTSGKCSIMNYPLAYYSQSNRVDVIWGDMAKCNLGSITGKKVYEVTLKTAKDDLISPGGVLSIFILMVPLAEEAPSILCIQGRLTISSKNYNVEGNMAFWRFYMSTVGITADYNYDHSLNDMVQCTVTNNAKKDMRSICFYDESGKKVIPCVSSPTFSEGDVALSVRRGCRLTTAIPHKPGSMNLKLCWECDDAFGLITFNVPVDNSPSLLVKIRTDTPSVKYTGAPSIVRIEYVFENPTTVTIPSIQVEAKPKSVWGGRHNWFYVGIMTGEIQEIPPRQSKQIAFDVVLPLPGVYLFSHEDISVKYSRRIGMKPCNELIIPVE
ncbi:hypothetical protein BgAZ_204380 [Babesia gibsoni]|uniref:Uncharacterized protein n=1 Tax=Babesia gibsoni TaxID=33632 RepID=A0AAD8LRZ7_BABGI|nr:hypothetical protein BgAZ_204380 [Babesia gibsoni]